MYEIRYEFYKTKEVLSGFKQVLKSWPHEAAHMACQCLKGTHCKGDSSGSGIDSDRVFGFDEWPRNFHSTRLRVCQLTSEQIQLLVEFFQNLKH